MSKRRLRSHLPLLLALVLVACGLVAAYLSSRSLVPETSGVEKAEVDWVSDGDTLVVYLKGQREKVRLLYIDTPESVKQDSNANCSEGWEASRHMEEMLPAGTVVYLQGDGGDDRDEYGRLLRFVWLDVPSENPDRAEIRAKMLNAQLVADGYAIVTSFANGTALGDYLRDLEDAASSPFSSGRTAREAIKAGHRADQE